MIYEADTEREGIDRLASWINRARRITVLTGAGVSTDSGIPDFRGPEGLWTKNPQAEKMATLQHYLADPQVRAQAWRFRLETFEHPPRPNDGHLALVELEHRGKLHTLITQNVDGLHQEAGSSPEIVVEIHGTIREVICMSCGERRAMNEVLARVRAGEVDPPCRSCGGILKSATISFGQGLLSDDLARAERAARDCELLLAVGSTLTVYPIANVVPLAKDSGARIVIVNGEATGMDNIADAVLRGPISSLLRSLVSQAS
ncbi:MAG: NAD-dependent deacetylase [Candidatus Binatia bacterium]